MEDLPSWKEEEEELVLLDLNRALLLSHLDLGRCELYLALKPGFEPQKGVFFGGSFLLEGSTLFVCLDSQ